MADHRPFVMFPDPGLKVRAPELDEVNEDVRAIWDEMLLAMYQMPGVGLAAPQLGVNLRLAVLDCSETKNQPVRLANPEILWASEKKVSFREASPNLPGVDAEIQRPGEVEVRFLDETGGEQVRRFKDLWAISVQHQIDHLEGKLFIDRLSPLRRQRLMKTWRKGAQARQRGRA